MSTAHHGSGYRSLTIAIRRQMLESAWMALSGATRPPQLQFNPQITLSSGKGADILRLIRFILRELDRSDNLLSAPLIFGEVVGRTVSLYNLDAMTAGRGITFWPRGDSSHCSNPSRSCARFENFAEGGGLLPGSVAFDVTSAPFQITLSADDWDTTVKIIQGGVTKADFSCRSVSGNNPQCGAQAGNIAMADAFIAFVNRAPIAGRTVGATDIQVTHFLP